MSSIKRLDELYENDMKKLSFKTPSELEVFYFTYAKWLDLGPKKRHGELITIIWPHPYRIFMIKRP